MEGDKNGENVIEIREFETRVNHSRDLDRAGFLRRLSIMVDRISSRKGHCLDVVQ